MTRDKRAIQTVLSMVGPASFAEIALRAGEGLYPAMREMIDAGEVECVNDGDKLLYKLPS